MAGVHSLPLLTIFSNDGAGNGRFVPVQRHKALIFAENVI
jgi:hypothetical protein